MFKGGLRVDHQCK